MNLRSLLLKIVAVCAVVGAGSFWIPARSSFVHQTTDELRSMRDQLANVAAIRPLDDYEKVSRVLLDEELHRRWRMLGAGVLGVLSLVAAILVPRGLVRLPWAAKGVDSAPAAVVLAETSEQLAMARRRAANLLGVAVDAPPAVIEAAFFAQIAMRDPSRDDGLSPDLRQLARSQREALKRARELLITPPDSTASRVG